jgi:hypothetical protein
LSGHFKCPFSGKSPSGSLVANCGQPFEADLSLIGVSTVEVQAIVNGIMMYFNATISWRVALNNKSAALAALLVKKYVHV